ncbi:calponin homology domain-containing protein DDB_G0272472 isoform X2 [Pieris brassicae]|uniref:calponin homology domain-containing protein DDB_G0272472 isoform X2 n=1 Tax=Pieris brassicae TaxID=7116 RepID=UPI001E661B08|nr:calponin homology domain-containing protein DDB_G0272472 isoform X2 [Pieris brassicae]XP_045530254.1 calponin homology domain-containing protein DDB_G0272472 isoform X2 [Pieris brassicae]
MFNFFKRKSKADSASTPEPVRKQPSSEHTKLISVEARAQNDNVTNEKTGTTRKDVVNLLLPETDYSQKTTVGAFLNIMGRKRRNKRKRESCRTQENPSNNHIDRPASPTLAKNTEDAPRTADDSDCVRQLVLSKYAKTPRQHVSHVYVNEPNLDDKRHAEALLREIAKTIDCNIDLNDQMGIENSKPEPVYDTVEENIDAYKNELKGELEKLLQEDSGDKISTEGLESSAFIKKSNLKPPRSEEGCSDDDRSDNGKKRVTFRKHIVFDDGEQQTDEEADSSFESLTSEEPEYLEDDPDYNKTIIKVESPLIRIDCVEDLKRISGDNSDSGFLECDKESGDETSVKSVESESEEEIERQEELEEDSDIVVIEESDAKDLVNQETKFQAQVATLTELADNRCEEIERARDIITSFRKEIDAKDQEIDRLKRDLASAYKESELIRQRSRSLEEELGAARSCSADLADQLNRRNDEAIRAIRAELEDSNTRCAELESRVEVLERDKARLEQEKLIQEQKAQEALSAAEANISKWRSAHEAARSQAAARAERILADCEWKMRELEKRARDAEKEKKELSETVDQLKSSPPTPSHIAELQQLRGLLSEQQRSVQSLTLQLQMVETREESLKLEVHRLKDLLEKEARIMQDKEEQHLLAIERLKHQHSEHISSIKSEHSEAMSSAASARATLERAHAEKTRTTLANLRIETERDTKNAERKLREVTTRFENLKEVLAAKEAQFERAIAEANSKADWDILQLRHLLDKADINYANNVEMMNERFEKEKERLTEEWSTRLRLVEEQATTDAEDARRNLESTRSKLIAEKNDQISKMKEKHRLEMEEQWEQFMEDKENCLERMKSECRQEGDEERVKREKDLLEEIAELKSQMQSKSHELDALATKTAACGRTLAVTEQELREALEREKDLREKRGDDAAKLKQVEKASREQIEHLTRKCACLRKLFDDMRARLTARERAAAEESRAKDKELHHLRAEVARLTKLLVEQGSQKLGARTRADGCEKKEEAEDQTQRRKGTLLCY